MSKESEPILSRRQLREQLAKNAGAAGKPTAPSAVAPENTSESRTTPGTRQPPAESPAAGVSSAKAAAPAAPRERESQTRARDRAALRAYKELVDSSEQNPLPTRRAIRQAQLDADRAPVTAVNPVVSALPKNGEGTKVPTVPAAPPASRRSTPAAAEARPGETPAAAPKTPAAAPRPATRTRAGRRAAVPAPNAPGNISARQVREAAAVQEERAPKQEQEAAPEAVLQHPVSAQETPVHPELTSVEADEAQANALAAIQARAAAAMADKAARGDAGPLGVPAGKYAPMPGLTPGGNYYPVSAAPPPATPTTEELRVLAAERAEAERAAILAERAKARERLAQESAKNKRPAADPTATDNLAMVTPLDFMEVPGAGRPVLRPPTTTHVPIVTRATPKQTPRKPLPPRPAGPTSESAADRGSQGQDQSLGDEPGTSTSANPTVRSVSAERFDAALAARSAHRPGPGNRPLTGGRSSTLKRAEAMATDSLPKAGAAVERVPVTRSQMPPMPADYAHGLEPLDAVTAGLGRTQRNMLIQWGSVALGGIALVVGLIMLLTSL